MALPIRHAGEGRTEQVVLPGRAVEGAQEALDPWRVEPGAFGDLPGERRAAFGTFGNGGGRDQTGISDTSYFCLVLWYRQYQIRGNPAVLRLLASTDFALRLLMRLGAEPERHRSTEALAAELGVPRNHLHKIVQDLVGLGAVRTLRGAHGGVMLARPAAELRLGPLVRQLEAGQALAECFRPDGGACRLSPDCRLRGVLWQAREAFFGVLDRTSLADCLGPQPGTLPHVVGDMLE